MHVVEEISAETLQDWQRSGRAARIIDVRSTMETAQGLIEGAEAMPLHLIPVNLSRLAAESSPACPLVLVCRSGARSWQAAAFLGQHGVPHVFNLRGGLIAWISAGYPLAVPGAGVTTAA